MLLDDEPKEPEPEPAGGGHDPAFVTIESLGQSPPADRGYFGLPARSSTMARPVLEHQAVFGIVL
jgi:hypothetical protein